MLMLVAKAFQLVGGKIDDQQTPARAYKAIAEELLG